MNEQWAPLVEVRMGTPMYTPDQRKLYPIYLYRGGEPTLHKYVSPQAAYTLGTLLTDTFFLLGEEDRASS